jgi:vesicle coat complex subunit
MTEDTSPENLRKFLESDDPAMVMMGLSMAKGSGLTEDVLPTILRLYMWNDNKTIRAAAKSFFIKHAPNDVKTKVKENWKPNYRTLSVTGDKYSEIVKPFLEAFKSQDDFALIALEPLIKALGDEDSWVGKSAAESLGKIGDKRAVEPLIKALGDKNRSVRKLAATALGEIGDKRAVEPLIKTLEDDYEYVRKAAATALGSIGDKRAVESLIKTLEDKNRYVRRSAAIALGKIGDKRAVEPLIKSLEDKDVRYNTTIALVKITKANIKGKEQKNIIKFLESDDEGMVMMGASILKGILEE